MINKRILFICVWIVSGFVRAAADEVNAYKASPHDKNEPEVSSAGTFENGPGGITATDGTTATRSSSFRTTGNLEKCGFASNEGFRAWFESRYLFTNSPVLFPETDHDLRDVVTTAKANGCKVRVRGSGQATDGIVMQKLDELVEDIIVINLKDYTPGDSQWDGVLDVSKPSIKISAGASLTEMMAIARPQGYLPTTNPDGSFFSVGGAYMNPSTHGATIEESRLAAQVVSFRVMNADGIITEYTDVESVKDFRGSLGLLGIVTALEIKLVPDEGFEMTLDNRDIGGYTDQDLRSLFESKVTDFDSIQLQYFVYTDSLVSYQINFNSGAAPIDPSSTQAFYDEQLALFPDLAYTGGNANALVWLVGLLADWIDGSKFLASTVSSLTLQQSIDGFNSFAANPRDGYYIPNDSVPKINLIHLFIPCQTDCVDEMLDLFLQTRDFAKAIITTENSDWYPTLPLDWRVITVQPDEMILENLSPGRWISWEYFTLFVDGDATDTKYLKQLEDMWRGSYPDAQVHLGKAYGYGPVPGVGERDEEFPFQDNSVLDNVFTQETKQRFREKMNEYDPSGTFRGGSVLRLLEDAPDDRKYTPKQYVGDVCESYKDAECISGCCDYKLLVPDTCERNDKPYYEHCDRDCECASNNCGWLWFAFRCKQ